jgi:hypothetical protein
VTIYQRQATALFFFLQSPFPLTLQGPSAAKNPVLPDGKNSSPPLFIQQEKQTACRTGLSVCLAPRFCHMLSPR